MSFFDMGMEKQRTEVEHVNEYLKQLRQEVAARLLLCCNKVKRLSWRGSMSHGGKGGREGW